MTWGNAGKAPNRWTGGGWTRVQHKGQWWTCQVPECQAELKKLGKRPWYNAKSEELCGFCHMPWQAVTTQSRFEDAQRTAREAATARVTQGADTPTPKVPATKAQSRRVRAKKAAAAGKGQPGVTGTDGAKPEADAVAAEANEDACDVDEEQEPQEEKTKKLLSPAEIKELADALYSPKPLAAGWTVAKAIAKEEVDPQKGDREQEELRGEMADCEALLEMDSAAAARLGINHKIIKDRLASIEKQLAKPGAKNPAPAVTAAQLFLDKETYAAQHKEKRLIAQRGAAKARRAFVTLQDAQRAHVKYWQDQMQATAEAELVRQQEWSDRDDLLQERHQQVLDEFDRRARSAKAGTSEEHEASTAAQAASAVKDGAMKPIWRETLTFFETVALDFDPSSLPKIDQGDLANAAVVAALGNLHTLLTYWMQAGAAVPFSFQQLSQESVVGKDSMLLTLRMLGEQQNLWYTDGPATETDLLPRQAAIAIYGVLETAKIQYEGLEEAKKNAAVSYGMLTDQHKKRRIVAQ